MLVRCCPGLKAQKTKMENAVRQQAPQGQYTSESSKDTEVPVIHLEIPLLKMKAHTRVVRPRVEPRRVLQNGVPTLSNRASSSNIRCQPQLNVSNLHYIGTVTECPRSITCLSVDDLIFQPPPPGSRSIPVSLHSDVDQQSLKATPPVASRPQRTLVADVSGKAVPNPPQQHRGGTESSSARFNKQIVHLFPTLLFFFGAGTAYDLNCQPVHSDRPLCSFHADEILECSWKFH